MTDANPFKAPATYEAATDFPPPTRPTSPMVIGILSIMFAVLGLFSLVITVVMMDSMDMQQAYDQMGFSLAYMRFSTFVGAVFTLVQVAAGVGLVRYRNWGRMAFNFYAIVTILWSIAQTSYMMVRILNLQNADPALTFGMITGAIGGLVGLIFPILGLVFLNLQRVRESLT